MTEAPMMTQEKYPSTVTGMMRVINGRVCSHRRKLQRPTARKLKMGYIGIIQVSQ